MRLSLIVLIVVLASCTKESTSDKQANLPATQSNSVSTIIPFGQNATLLRDHVSTEGKQLFSSLYGGTVWKDSSINKFFDKATEAYTSPKFEARFIEGGKNKLLVLGYVAPTEDYICHACVPLLGGAIFRFDNSSWVIESKQTIIGWGDVLETGEFQLVQVGPDKYGIALHITDAHQGYEDNRYVVIIPYKGNLVVALDSGFIEKPGEAAYISDDVGLAEQSVNISFSKGNNPEYFDVLLKLNYNEEEGTAWHLKSEMQHFTFREGQYVSNQAEGKPEFPPSSAGNVASSPTPASAVSAHEIH